MGNKIVLTLAEVDLLLAIAALSNPDTYSDLAARALIYKAKALHATPGDNYLLQIVPD